MKCPKCFYALTLREYSRKYKCPACGNLFPQKELELKEFHEFNKKKRQEEIQIELEKILQEKLVTLAFLTIIRECNIRQSVLFNRVLYRDLYNQKKREYWAKSREHLLAKRRENYIRQKDKISGQQALYRQNNKMLRRINHLRTRQKELTLRFLENGSFKPFTFEFEDTLPTFVLSELH